MRARAFIFTLAVTAIAAVHAKDADLDALQLANRAAANKAASAPEARWFVEGMLGASDPRTPPDERTAGIGRLSLDLQWDKSLDSGLRFLLASRLDVTGQKRPSAHDSVNTLKEAYLSWQPRPDRFLDAGRINVRNGVATGYNPTDYFREGAIRSLTSVDPVSLRANRMGTAALRGQFLWDDGSLAALVSPKVSDTPHDAVFHPDLAATNNRNRWLLALSQRITDDLTPQFLLYGPRAGEVRAGLNIASLVGDATVVFAEWSAGRTPSQLSQALGTPGEYALRHQVATGLTYTTASKLSLTLEYDYNGAGLDRGAWGALRAGPNAAYGQYRRWAGVSQELPTKQRVFALATWQDVFIDRLDWSAMVRHTVEDRSRTFWTELRYRWTTTELALQWQSNHGDPTSDFGAASLHRSLQLSLRQFF
jgi:hypothetical protein